MIGIIEVYGSMLLRALGQTLLLTLLSLLSVSYTHLDVYKRQVHIH